MIECIFTIDYEIYGNGQGTLQDLVHEPARKLKAVFDQAGAKFVVFAEAAEFERIAAAGTDEAITAVERQLAEFYQQGFEIALHLHPQWYNARFREGQWELDYSEYNLCTLPKRRLEEILDRSLSYLRRVLAAPAFTPGAFRAGNWLFQPCETLAAGLAERGIQIDSSVFKGGRLRSHQIDYRRASRNGYYWRFQRDVNVPEAGGALLEIPIYTQMVPPWRMLTRKRVALQQKGQAAAPEQPARHVPRGLLRLRDYLRFRYPLKFDFCRMNLGELTGVVERVMRDDRNTPGVFKPLVAIGHTKDLVDLETVAAFLGWLKRNEIPVSTLAGTCGRCRL
jgi:hypothetical protein